MIREVFYSATLLPVLVLAVSASGPLQERRLPIPDRGALLISTPLAWAQQIGQPPDEITSTIRFSSAAGQKFEVAIVAF